MSEEKLLFLLTNSYKFHVIALSLFNKQNAKDYESVIEAYPGKMSVKREQMTFPSEHGEGGRWPGG